MTREIKFRAWDKESKVMLNDVSTGTVDIWCADKQTKASAKDCIFMQFTGLLDKNGEEIYEGDILECFAKNKPEEKVYNLEVKLPDFYREIWSNEDENIFVIGNIYKNKVEPLLADLLK